jgi:hypothetical protein
MNVPSDILLLAIMEGICGVGLLLIVGGIPLSDWWMRRRIRKQIEYTRRFEEELERRANPQVRYIHKTPHGEN